MAYVALIIAVLALVGAGILLFLGKRNEERTPAQDAELEPETEPAHTAEPVREPEPESAPEPHIRPARRAGLQLPGAMRRERRNWAEQHDFEFRRSDEYLIDEWSRGAAATGAAAKDIAHGFVYGHEMLLMDLGGVNTMAMRTGVVSDVVVDMRRDSFSAATSHDLLEVMHIEGFTVYATEVGPAERMIDDRVITALENMPEVVSAVWCESEWVLAQTERGSTPEDWDRILAPLGLLADSARVLPPQTWQTLEFSAPTREMGEPLHVQSEPQVAEEAELHPNVVRPEEPLEMPTRITGTTRGVIEPRAIGGDEVDAIADGNDEPIFNDGTRVAREKKPPSIFDDEDATRG